MTTGNNIRMPLLSVPDFLPMVQAKVVIKNA